MARKKDASYSRLFEEFAGSYITIAVRSLKGSQKTNKIIANVMLAGYLLDECEDYYYIGENSKEIFAAVKKTDVSTIMLGGEGAENNIDLPEGSEMQ